MAYLICSQVEIESLGAMAQHAADVHEALRKARQMYQIGLVCISITDFAGHKIDGDNLLECIKEKKSISNDLMPN
jgi:hypothetical protein